MLAKRKVDMFKLMEWSQQNSGTFWVHTEIVSSFNGNCRKHTLLDLDLDLVSVASWAFSCCFEQS